MFNKPRFFSRDINATFAGINHDGYGSMWISLRSSRKKKKRENVKKSREDFTIFRAKQKVSRTLRLLSRLFRVCKSHTDCQVW